MKTTTVGLDWAKSVSQVRAETAVKRQLKRGQVSEFFVNLSPCLIGMKVCGSAHHRARKRESLGHAVRLMAPELVKPYVKTNKNDAADAEVI